MSRIFAFVVASLLLAVPSARAESCAWFDVRAAFRLTTTEPFVLAEQVVGGGRVRLAFAGYITAPGPLWQCVVVREERNDRRFTVWRAGGDGMLAIFDEQQFHWKRRVEVFPTAELINFTLVPDDPDAAPCCSVARP